MRFGSKQRGVSLVNLMAFLFMAGFFAAMLWHVVPHYYEREQIRDLIQDIAKEADIAKGGKAKILSVMQLRLNMNQIELPADSIEIIDDPKTQVKTLRVSYQKESHFIESTSFVTSIDESVELPK